MKPISKDSTLTEIQAHLNEVCKERGWDKNSIFEVYLLLSEETGELAKSIRKITGFKGEKKPVDIEENLQEELADVLNYLLEIANRFDINLAEAYTKKALKNKKRSWE